MLAWSEELITDVRKPEIMVMTSWRTESYLLILRSPSQTCHAKPKTQINRRRTLPASFPLVGCLPQATWPERLLSEKSGRCGIAADKERGALPMIDRGDIRQAIDRCSNIWSFTAGRWLWSVQARKPDLLIAKFKKAGGTVRD